MNQQKQALSFWSVLEALYRWPTAGSVTLEHGLHGPRRLLSREQLLATSQALAHHFQSLGLEPGDRVLTLLPTGEAFLRTLLAAWWCRAAIVPVAPLGPGARSSSTRERTRAVISASSPKLIVGTLEALRELRSINPTEAVVLTDAQVMKARKEGQALPLPDKSDLALLQFTSGSTAQPRGVIVRHGMIAHNMIAASTRMEVRASDRMVSWLPVYHDMGLIGGICYPLCHGFPTLLLPTERFGADPSAWLRAISDFRGTLSPAPNFAFELLARRVPEGRLNGLDLSSWRYSNVGAEPIFFGILDTFIKRFATYGLSEVTLQPSYGLAEATLAVSMRAAGKPLRVEMYDRTALQAGRAVPASSGAEAVPLISNGPLLPGIEMAVIDSQGEQCSEGTQGKLMLRGPYVTEGYFGADNKRGEAEWLDTGDLGFVSEGEVFITGRVKDLIIRSGANVHPQDVERAAAQVKGVRLGCVAAFSRMDHSRGREETVLVAEARASDAESRASLIPSIRRCVAEAVGLQLDTVVLTAPKTLPKTTSGKIQRSKTRELLEAGLLPSDSPAEAIGASERLRLWYRLKLARLRSGSVRMSSQDGGDRAAEVQKEPRK